MARRFTAQAVQALPVPETSIRSSDHEIHSDVFQPGGRLDRSSVLDYARLVAASGIVLFHSGAPGAAIGYAALPFFLVLLVVLALPGAARQSF